MLEPLKMRLEIRDEDALEFGIVALVDGQVLGQSRLEDGAVADALHHLHDVRVIDAAELVPDEAGVFAVVARRQIRDVQIPLPVADSSA